MVQLCFGNQLSAAALGFPRQSHGEAAVAGLPRRVLDRAAVLALLQLEAAERRRGGEAERGAAARRPAAASAAACAGPDFFFWARGQSSQRIAAPGCPSPRSKLIMPKPLTSPSFASFTCRAPASPVSWRIASTKPRKPPAAPAWPTESWPPEVLCGKEPSCVKRVPADEGGRFVLAAEAEVLELHRDDHRVVVVGLDEVDVLRAQRRLARRGRPCPAPSRRAPGSGRRRTRCAARWSP